MLGDDFFDELYHGTASFEHDHKDDPGFVSDFGQPRSIGFTDTTTGIEYGYADTEYGRAQARAKLEALNACYHSVDPNPLAARKLGVIEGTYASTMPQMPDPRRDIQILDYDTSFGGPLYDSYDDEEDDDELAYLDEEEREERYRRLCRDAEIEEDDDSSENLPSMESTRAAYFESEESDLAPMESSRPF